MGENAGENAGENVGENAGENAGKNAGETHDPNAWSDVRVLLFTEYGDTKRYLYQLLSAAVENADRGDERIMQFHGGMSDEQREEVQNAFNAPPDEHPVRILIATDAAREGINLQAHCADLFHFDVPWNPARVYGRADRRVASSARRRAAVRVTGDGGREASSGGVRGRGHRPSFRPQRGACRAGARSRAGGHGRTAGCRGSTADRHGRTTGCRLSTTRRAERQPVVFVDR